MYSKEIRECPLQHRSMSVLHEACDRKMQVKIRWNHVYYGRPDYGMSILFFTGGRNYAGNPYPAGNERSDGITEPSQGSAQKKNRRCIRFIRIRKDLYADHWICRYIPDRVYIRNGSFGNVQISWSGWKSCHDACGYDRADRKILCNTLFQGGTAIPFPLLFRGVQDQTYVCRKTFSGNRLWYWADRTGRSQWYWSAVYGDPGAAADRSKAVPAGNR